MDSIPAKIVSGQTYIHVDSLLNLPSDKKELLQRAEQLANVNHRDHFNLVRFDNRGQGIAFLNYPGFFDEPFPSLRESWKVDLDGSKVSYRSFAESHNPPILHRKELLLQADDIRRKEYEELTDKAQSLGLFENSKTIGYQKQWLALIREKGYRIEGHSLFPISQDEHDENVNGNEELPKIGWKASRHLTALTRYGFSTPITTLARHGFLDGSHTLFDYGCGRGDDIRGLVENGLSATGWDPFFAPDRPKSTADIINLGFVLNVIEDVGERMEALTQAWSLTERLLVVSVMLANQNQPNGQQFNDGVMTSRGTFQKYFTQTEFRSYLEQVLDEKTIPVAPGVLYVFRDKDMEQRFLIDRYSRGRNRLNSPSPEPRSPQQSVRRDRVAEKYEEYQEPLERLWEKWIELGRKPDKSEIENLVVLISGFGSAPKALRFLEQHKDMAEIERATTRRIEDLEVYFALNQFERRKPYKNLDKTLQRDVRVFFGNYTNAEGMARELLFKIADVEAIEKDCKHAAELGLGWLEEGEYLQLHVSLVEQLPPLLRIYLGCAFVLYGDYQTADLVKIHIHSGKVSLMRFDDFEGKALPQMIERVKIKLREQDIDYFSYGEGTYKSPFLYRKSRYINEEFLRYPEQLAFDEALEATGLFDFTDYGPEADEFTEILAKNRWFLDGFELVKTTKIPKLSDACGSNLTFQQLIECGETQARTGLPNLPKQSESYDALHELAINMLDHVIDYFGMIHLTFGFCSPKLAKEISGRISPKLDQHAAHELNQRGKLICERLGAAVDFLVEDECMLEVAQWVAENAPFDRLYFYGKDRPIHVSYGPDNTRQVVLMKKSKTGLLVPRVISLEDFCAVD